MNYKLSESKGFDGMKIHGSDMLSVLTSQTREQPQTAMDLYNATEGNGFGDKLMPFIQRWGDNPGLLNFSGSIISLALSNKLLSPEQLAEAVKAINERAEKYKDGERFGYFDVPFKSSNPKGRILVRDPNYDLVIVAKDMGNAQEYAKHVESTGRNLMTHILEIVKSHGIERSLIVGPVIDDLAE